MTTIPHQHPTSGSHFGPGSTHDPVTDSVAAYSDHVEAYTNHNADLMAEAADAFIAALRPGSPVLDAGCGPGRDLRRFLDAGLAPVGLDLNPEFVAVADQIAPTQVGDLRNIPFSDHTFAGTWACASLVHLPIEDAITALGEIKRVTRPGGIVAVSVKHAGSTGWAETAHGRRWFQIWEPHVFADIVAGCGLAITDVTIGPVFVDVWATA